MEKKYQVFVSSTYQDLLEERSEVIQALLELDCIPVGMEFFPAADEDQWTLIKRLIDDCDYYILIVGGRYGSIHPTENISYTQLEYEYALTQNIPTIAFVHKNPSKIESGKTDQDSVLKSKLENFKVLVQQKTCKSWETSVELGGIVSRSLVKLIKDKPRPGWVKSTYVPDEDTNLTILELRKKVDSLKEELDVYKLDDRDESLAQGSDIFHIPYTAQIWNLMLNSGKEEKAQIETTWNDIFSVLSPFMVHEIEENGIRDIIRKYIINRLYPEKKNTHWEGINLDINEDIFQTIKIQLQALGLIEQSNKKRSIKDTATYWKLTTKGDSLMINLRAIRRNKEVIDK